MKMMHLNDRRFLYILIMTMYEIPGRKCLPIAPPNGDKKVFGFLNSIGEGTGSILNYRSLNKPHVKKNQ